MKPLLLLTLPFYVIGFFAFLAGHLSCRAGSLSKAGRYIAGAGFIVHTAALAERIYSTGHAPMASMYETLAFYAWMTALVSLIVNFRYKETATSLITMPLAVAAIVFAMPRAQAGGPLTLILKTRWFETHVSASFAAYALFTLAFAGATLYIINALRGVDEQGLKRYQEIAGKAVLWGFFLFSASMFAGAIWGYLAWGAYWMWEPKIIWSFIVWFYFAGAMHAYYVKEWRGMGLSVATAIGFFVVGFTYLGVSMLMKSSHSF